MKLSLLLPLVVALAMLTVAVLGEQAPAPAPAPIFQLPGPNNTHCEPQLCRRGKKHVACEKYAKDFHRSCQPEFTRLVNLTDYADKILHQHNERRNRVAAGKNTSLPRAARMVVMRWSEELAAVAGYNTRMCQAKHDDCRNTQNFTQSGQNIIVFNMTRLVDDEMLHKLYPELISIGVRTWWGEHKNMSAAAVDSYPCDKKQQQHYRHFAVMAVESNSHVGCAAVRYIAKDVTFFKITCNYAKDFECGQPLYRFRAVGCSTGLNKKHKSLCSKKEIFA